MDYFILTLHMHGIGPSMEHPLAAEAAITLQSEVEECIVRTPRPLPQVFIALANDLLVQYLLPFAIDPRPNEQKQRDGNA